MNDIPAGLPDRLPRTNEEQAEVARLLNIPRTDLFVLDGHNDPANTGSPEKVALGEWFKELWERFGYLVGVHIRRIHYRAAIEYAGEVQLPDGTRYENYDEHAQLLYSASAHARDMDLVSATLFVDRRNAPAIRNAAERTPDEPGWEVVLDGQPVSESLRPWYTEEFGEWPEPDFNAVPLPELELPPAEVDPDRLGEVRVDGYGYSPGDQPYYEALWIEKSTQNDWLVPLCERLGVDLLVSQGFASKTQAVELLLRTQELGKDKLFVGTLADYDPAGASMPVGLARELQFYRELLAPDVEVVVRHLGMHAEWVERYDLPRKPIKAADARKAKFEERHGEGAVELDAIEALHPGAAAREIEAQIRQYRDEDLRARLEAAEAEAEDGAQQGWGLAVADVRTEIVGEAGEIDAVVQRYQERVGDLMRRRDEAMEPIIGELARLETEATRVLVPLRDEYVELEREYDEEIAEHTARLDELWGAVQAVAEDLEVELPERPEAEVDVDESDALLDTSRHWWTQHLHFREVQKRPVDVTQRSGVCEVCGEPYVAVRTTPGRTTCSDRCRKKLVRQRQREDS